MRTLLPRFRRAEHGVASIEFALLSSVMLTLFAGTFDLVYMVAAARDADRASMLIARSIVSCSTMACMQDFLNTYPPREPNALVRYPSATLGLYVVARINGTISTCFGVPTKQLTDSDATTSALNIMRENDIGAVAIVSTKYTSMLPKAVLGYISTSGATYRDYAVDVFRNYSDANTANAICAGTK